MCSACREKMIITTAYLTLTAWGLQLFNLLFFYFLFKHIFRAGERNGDLNEERNKEKNTTQNEKYCAGKKQ